MSRLAFGKALCGKLYEGIEHGTTQTLQASALDAAERVGLKPRRVLKDLAVEVAALEQPWRKVSFRPLEAFERDLQHFGVRRVSKQELAAQRRVMHQLQLAHLRELAARNPGLQWLGMSERKARTLGALLDHELGRGMALQGSALARQAQEAARALSKDLLRIWNGALPRGRELERVLSDTLKKLEDALARKPDLSPTKFVRKNLFDRWRGRFMKALGDDQALVNRLRDQAGLHVVPGGSRPHFELHWSIDGQTLVVGIDIDHAEVGLADAVNRALRPPRDPAALLSIVRGESLQLTEPRQNRAVFEWVRRANREIDATRGATTDWLREDELKLIADVDKAIANLMAARRDEI
jgi:hypothetical protein